MPDYSVLCRQTLLELSQAAMDSSSRLIVASLGQEYTHGWQFFCRDQVRCVKSISPTEFRRPVPPELPGPDGAVGAGPLGGLGLFGPLGGLGSFGPLGGFGLLGPLGGLFGGALRSLGLFGFFGALGLSGLLLPGAFGPLGLFGGLLGLLGFGLAGCCESCMPAALKSNTPIPGVTANAPIEINATDHRKLRKFIVRPLAFTIKNDAILRCSQQDRQSCRISS